MLLNGKVCECEITIALFELNNDFDTIGYGMIFCYASAFNYVSMLLVGAIIKC